MEISLENLYVDIGAQRVGPSGLKAYYGRRCFLKAGGFINFHTS